jgi:hypothetical protein
VIIEITSAGLGRRNLRFNMRATSIELSMQVGSLSGAEDGAADGEPLATCCCRRRWPCHPLIPERCPRQELRSQ